MPYSIDYSDSSKTAIVVNDGTVDTSTSISLLGKNYTRFGEIFNENMLHLLENFANTNAPTNPTEGQLWYDTQNSCLKIHDNGQWYQIGAPAGSTRFEYRNRQDTGGSYHKTVECIVDNNIVWIATDDTNSWNPHGSEYLEDGVTALSTQFPNIQAGIQMNNTTNYKFRGVATSAEYADLAERYHADEEYFAGTVVKIGGANEITQTTQDADPNVFGVISNQPGFEMNSAAGDGVTHPFVALAGRVPCNVVGLVEKGDRLVSADHAGSARVATNEEIADYRRIIGRALESKTEPGFAQIEIIVGAK